MANLNERNVKVLIGIVMLLFLITFSTYQLSNQVYAIPQGANITGISTENATVRPAESHTAAGGSFTTLLVNVTSQTSKWKAYIGNITGKTTLDNGNGMTIYDWELTTIQGEIYVSRNDSLNFTTMACANTGNITNEESQLGINSTSDDSINSTFNMKIHRSFVIGGTGTIGNSTCFSVATYVNDASQAPSESATFQEVLLSDGRNLVFVGLLENKQQGFDYLGHDFQLILPDNPSELSNTYYFFAELG